MPLPSSRTARGALVGLLLPIVVAALLLAPGGAGPRPASPSPPSGATRLWATEAPIALVLSPGTWTLEPGGTVAVAAALENVPGGCAISPAATLWSLVGLSADFAGLNVSVGPSVEVREFGALTGFFSVTAELTTIVDCGFLVGELALWSNATITVLPALALTPFAVGPDPAAPGRPVDLNFTVGGGSPPYAVSVAFGDGQSENLTLDGAGPVEVPHRYAVGIYAPEVAATDALGERAEVAAPESLVVSGTMRAGVATNRTVTEVGVPDAFSAVVVGGVPPYNVSWYVDGSPVPSETGDADAASVDPTAAGPLTVGVGVTDAAGDVSVSDRVITVLPDPGLSASAASDDGEVGRPFPVAVNLSGGLGPYVLSWRLGPEGNSTSENLSANGTVEIAPLPPSPSSIDLELRVVDAYGLVATDALWIGPFGLPPFLSLAFPSATTEAGRPLRLAFSIVDGVPPFDWSVEPSETLTNVSATSGSADTGTALLWSGVPLAPGNLSFRVLVLDAEGGFSEANGSVLVLAPVSVQLSAPLPSPSAGLPFPIDLFVSGGLAPYSVTGAAGEGPTNSTELGAPGPVAIELVSPGSGYVPVSLGVTDAAGGSWSRNETLYVGVAGPTPPSQGAGTPPPSGSPAEAGDALGPWVGVAVLAALGVGVLFVVVRRRTRPVDAAPGPSDGVRALELVRRALRDADGCDLDSLTLIAEEAGISAEATAAALARWDRAGRVRRERDPWGGEVCRWVAPEAPTIADGDGTEAA